MKFQLIGVNHKTAPVEVRERLAIPDSRLPEALKRLAEHPGVDEGLILSTCNRVEVLAPGFAPATATAPVDTGVLSGSGPSSAASARQTEITVKLALPKAIKTLAHDPAAAVGLNDRGKIARGYKADLNVIDYDALRLFEPSVASDLPAGGKRLMQYANGYAATIVSGEIIRRDGEATGKLPGRLVRGAKGAPAG